jgi:hypothetical protein
MGSFIFYDCAMKLKFNVFTVKIQTIVELILISTLFNLQFFTVAEKKNFV